MPGVNFFVFGQPLLRLFMAGFNATVAVLPHVTNEVDVEVDDYLAGARDITACGARSQHHQKIWIAFIYDTEEDFRQVILPVILEPPAAWAANVDAIKGAGRGFR